MGLEKGEPDTLLPMLNAIDITSISKTRQQERPIHAMSKMLYTNHQLSYGALTLNLAEQENS